jgi:hypothetical protein
MCPLNVKSPTTEHGCPSDVAAGEILLEDFPESPNVRSDNDSGPMPSDIGQLLHFATDGAYRSSHWNLAEQKRLHTTEKRKQSYLSLREPTRAASGKLRKYSPELGYSGFAARHDAHDHFLRKKSLAKQRRQTGETARRAG